MKEPANRLSAQRTARKYQRINTAARRKRKNTRYIWKVTSNSIAYWQELGYKWTIKSAVVIFALVFILMRTTTSVSAMRRQDPISGTAPWSFYNPYGWMGFKNQSSVYQFRHCSVYWWIQFNRRLPAFCTVDTRSLSLRRRMKISTDFRTLLQYFAFIQNIQKRRLTSSR